MTELEDRIRAHYLSKRLPEDRLNAISEAGIIARYEPPSKRILILTAACWAIAGVFFLLSHFLSSPTNHSVSHELALQVWKNHEKDLAPEIVSDSLVTIQGTLDRVSASLTPTFPDTLQGLTVEGGRYCSLLDELAAQINLRSEKGVRCTLYVAPVSESLASVEPGLFELEDGTVQIWLDDGRVFAMAQ
ncbi:MAG: hypothetical protein AAGJ81_14425 [Verrucomicrobiota bacterium]